MICRWKFENHQGDDWYWLFAALSSSRRGAKHVQVASCFEDKTNPGMIFLSMFCLKQIDFLERKLKKSHKESDTVYIPTLKKCSWVGLVGSGRPFFQKVGRSWGTSRFFHRDDDLLT